MSMTTEHTPMDPEAEAALIEQLRNDVNALPGRLARFRQIERDAIAAKEAAVAAHRVELAAHKAAIDEAVAKHRAECAARDTELRGRESNVAAAEQALLDQSRKLALREQYLENRLSDMGNRIRAGAA
jgi:hypothetical protein